MVTNHAEQKFREASQWWAVFHVAIDKYRAWIVLWHMRRAMRSRILVQANRHFKLERLDHLTSLIEEAHDRALVVLDEVWTAAQCAVASELAGRIYYEADEGLERDRIRIKEDLDV